VPVTRYLQEDGTGKYRGFHVPDLVPGNADEVEVLLVLESPHLEELGTRLPLSGDAGQNAFTFLMPIGSPTEALGPYLATAHAAGDFRVGVLNTCMVPLQKAAFKGHPSPPALPQPDWDLLELVRKHRATTISGLPTSAAGNANRKLLPGLQSRLSALNLFPNATVFIAGNFVQRTWDSLSSPPQATVVPIPHPANGWWARTKRPDQLANLATLKSRFASSIS